ncbi:acyl-CoA dehydratase activase [Dethiosulfatarculus sandiegensis]|uniref:3-hydroxyacyl-ACP dehydratase n=1 Tax=Dethiosulfatarculus sandiegensis TaxID=1429043 RepID=A0A0D2JA54_9BACT|nr:acyl-CoA dehydratase activase [Dethiosulfatarculus sandiegensis]KIX12591.1 3-hydroxyacyl-ACP dehydratase [Dethiosulfatarculus sandiegensis]
MLVAGLDIGSRSIELLILEKGKIIFSQETPTTFDPLSQCHKLLRGRSWDEMAVTGYGRKLYSRDHEALTVSEIKAHALGARRLFPDCRSILDIGGQDTKALTLDENGNLLKFEMNDRCAAGTGKFLEFMARGMEMSLDEFGNYALDGRPGVTVNSMCTVFAESEATSLMAQGKRPQDIALALHNSVAKRSLAMLKRVGLKLPLAFSGGVAKNPCMVQLINLALGDNCLIAEAPEMVGALGAAWFAAQKNRLPWADANS